jgi:hypothetical protein
VSGEFELFSIKLLVVLLFIFVEKEKCHENVVAWMRTRYWMPTHGGQVDGVRLLVCGAAVGQTWVERSVRFGRFLLIHVFLFEKRSTHWG